MGNFVCEGVTKKYKDKVVLDQVNLEFENHKIYGLIGRNGVGKTTLLSMMSAQNPVTSGKIMLDGENVWENEKKLGDICFSRELNPTEAMGYYRNMRIKEYLSTAAIYYPNWDKEYAKELLEKFELDEKKRLYKCSKGMLSMVTIIVALASKARFTFLDEPVAGLDGIARDLFYRLLLQEYSDTDRTFVISTHILEEASNVFEEVIFLKDQKVLLKENTEELLARAVHVSGLETEVDRVTAGMQVYHAERNGRAKNVTVLLEAGKIIHDSKVDVSPMSLSNLFMALCGKEV